MTITESIFFKISMFVVCTLLFTACTTAGTSAGEAGAARRPQAAGAGRY